MEPDGLFFLPAFACALGAAFGAVGAWDKSSPTYRTVACGANAVQKRCFQCRVIGQYRRAEPFADQSTGMPLGTDITVGVVKEQAGPTVKVAAPFPDQGPHLTKLPPGESRQQRENLSFRVQQKAPPSCQRRAAAIFPAEQRVVPGSCRIPGPC